MKWHTSKFIFPLTNIEARQANKNSIFYKPVGMKICLLNPTVSNDLTNLYNHSSYSHKLFTQPVQRLKLFTSVAFWWELTRKSWQARMLSSHLYRYPSGERPTLSNTGPQQSTADMAWKNKELWLHRKITRTNLSERFKPRSRLTRL